MHGRHFHTELDRLRENAAEFADANPALAPLLNGPMTDPDVERLLDAVAFQNTLLGRKLDVDFPELILNLAHLILPHYMRPTPATTILGFTPTRAMGQSVHIPAGARIASMPVDGTCCRFTTVWDLDVHPLEITDAAILQTSERAAEIRLSFMLHGITLSQWLPGRIRLFLAGDRVTATGLYQLLCRRLKRIIVSAPGAETLVLPAGCLQQAGYGENDALVPWPPHAFPGYRLLQEYFTAPEKFLFFDLTGLDRWTGRGDAGHFSVSFLLDGPVSEAPKVGRANFVTNAVPAVNLFSHDADPIILDHRVSRYPIRPCGANSRHHRIFSVDGVTAITRSTGRERSYAPFDLFGSDTPGTPVYHAGLERSPAGDGYDAYLCTTFPDGTAFPVGETLSIALTCTNGALPENLRIGDIRTPESGIPATVSCINITPVHPGIPPPLGPELLWRLTTHLYLNHMPLGNVEHLNTLLKLYLLEENASGASLTANLKRVEGIEEVAVTPEEAMVEGVPVRGSHIRLKVRGDHFVGAGDLYLFGCVLDRFQAEYSSINHFTRLTIEELRQGEIYQWPMRQE